MNINEAYNNDCLFFMRQCKDKIFDLAIVDPPYGINAPKMNMGGYGKYESTAVKCRKGRLNQGAGKLKDRALNTMDCSWDQNPPTMEYFKELFRVSKNQLIFGGNYFDLPPTRCFVCWDKAQPWTNFSQVEYIWTSFDYPAKIIRISSRGGNNKEQKIHPTQKPVKLYEFLLKTFAKPGDYIFDSHMGSGSSRIAAYNLGFDYCGCEINSDYFDAACERFKTQCKKKVKQYERTIPTILRLHEPHPQGRVRGQA